MSPTWEVKLLITGHVSLDLDFNGIQFKREKDRNIAILFITAPEQQVLDEALDKCRRTLDKLAAIYDEGLKTTNQGAIVNRVSRYNKDGRTSIVSSFVTLTISLFKNERHKDEEMSKLLSEVTDESIIGTALGFYNKGLRAISTDPFDAFLSFWSCIITFIRKEVGRSPTGSDFKTFLKEFGVSENEAETLWGKRRSAIAHANYDPSSSEKISEISSTIPRIKELARRTIIEFLRHTCKEPLKELTNSSRTHKA